MASLAICNGKVNNLLEAVTFKPLFRGRQNVARLCSAQLGIFPPLESTKGCDVIQFCHKDQFLVTNLVFHT